MDYIDKLTQLRQDRDIDQSKIAELLCVKQSTISKYEKRKNKYTVDQLIKLCEFYHVSADYILGLPQDLNYPER